MVGIAAVVPTTTIVPTIAVVVSRLAVVPVSARVAAAVVTAGTPSIPPVPVAIRVPMTVVPVFDLYDSAGLHLLGYRHEDRRGV
jgi:hypothetical protein